MSPAEYEPIPKQPEQAPSVEERPEQAEIPKDLEQETGVQSTVTDPAQLSDDDGNVVATPVPAPADPSKTITIPAEPKIIHEATKGKPSESKTWWGVFWDRVIKQAEILHKQVIVGEKTKK